MISRVWLWVLSPVRTRLMRAWVAVPSTNSCVVSLLPPRFLVMSLSILCLCLASLLSCGRGVRDVSAWCLVKWVTMVPAIVGDSKFLFDVVVCIVWMTLLGLVLPIMNLVVFVLRVVNMHLLRVNAASTMMRMFARVGLLMTVCRVLRLLSLGTWTLTSMMLGCSVCVRVIVLLLLLVLLISVSLGLEVINVCSFTWIRGRLLVINMWIVLGALFVTILVLLATFRFFCLGFVCL